MVMVVTRQIGRWNNFVYNLCVNSTSAHQVMVQLYAIFFMQLSRYNYLTMADQNNVEGHLVTRSLRHEDD